MSRVKWVLGVVSLGGRGIRGVFLVITVGLTENFWLGKLGGLGPVLHDQSLVLDGVELGLGVELPTGDGLELGSLALLASDQPDASDELLGGGAVDAHRADHELAERSDLLREHPEEVHRFEGVLELSGARGLIADFPEGPGLGVDRVPEVFPDSRLLLIGAVEERGLELHHVELGFRESLGPVLGALLLGFLRRLLGLLGGLLVTALFLVVASIFGFFLGFRK